MNDRVMAAQATMTSPAYVVNNRESFTNERFQPYDDSIPLQLTPVPSGVYRCPVSTPANYVQYTGRIRRTKPAQRLYKQPAQPSNNFNKPKGQHRVTHVPRNTRPPKSVPWRSKNIDYYYVDQNENKREEQLTNTHWLKALCSQPVTEILGKYQTHTRVRRTPMTILRSCSTPGERSLLNAWENNITGHYSARGSKTAMGGDIRQRHNGMDYKDDDYLNDSGGRLTKSEPALSRANRVHSCNEYGNTSSIPPGKQNPVGIVSPRRGRGNNTLLAAPNSPEPPPVKGFLIDDTTSYEEEDNNGRLTDRSRDGSKIPKTPSQPRFVSFTTQIFRRTQKDGKDEIYDRLTKGPEHLPYISNNKRVMGMLNNTRVYGRSSNESNDTAHRTGDWDNESQGNTEKPTLDLNKIRSPTGSLSPKNELA